MFKEFEAETQAKEKFLAEYRPIRKVVEDFLKGGEKIKGQNVVLYILNVVRACSPFFNYDYPLGENLTYWKRETTIPSTHDQSVLVIVETDRALYTDLSSRLVGYSGEIDKAMIIVEVAPGPDGRECHLPPVWAIEENVFEPTFYSDIPQRLADVLDYLR